MVVIIVFSGLEILDFRVPKCLIYKTIDLIVYFGFWLHLKTLLGWLIYCPTQLNLVSVATTVSANYELIKIVVTAWLET